MSAGASASNNGVIRVGRKGVKKFAFGDDGPVFEVDVVNAFQEWVGIDESFRDAERVLPTASMPAYHNAAVQFATALSKTDGITTAEALDFLARLREAYDELADFFQPKSRTKPSSAESLEARFSHSET